MLIQLDLDAFALGRRARVVVRADVEADDDRAGGLGEQDVAFGDRADAAVDDLDLHFRVRRAGERVGERFRRPALIRLDEQLERCALASRGVRHEVFERTRHPRRPRGSSPRDRGARAAARSPARRPSPRPRGTGRRPSARRTMPSTCTGIAGPASFTGLPRSSNIARTRPEYMPQMKSSPTLQRAVLHQHRGDGTLARRRAGLRRPCPVARRFGFALRSRISACSRIWSSSAWTFVPFLAEISECSAWPPNSSSTTPCCSSSCFTFIGFAVGRSILLIATMIGTPAFLACEIASMVCGMTESSAATTSTTMSVTCAPRARMAVNAS